MPFVEVGTKEDIDRQLALIRETSRAAEDLRLRSITLQLANQVLRSVVVDEAVAELRVRADGVDRQLGDQRLRATQLIEDLLSPLPEGARRQFRVDLGAQVDSEIALGRVLAQDQMIRETGRRGVAAPGIAVLSGMATDLVTETAERSKFVDPALVELGFPELRRETLEGEMSVRRMVDVASSEARPRLRNAQADLAARLSLQGKIVRGMSPSQLLAATARGPRAEPRGLFGTGITIESLRRRQEFFRRGLR